MQNKIIVKESRDHIISYKGDEYGTRKRQNELLRMMKDVDHIFQMHEIKYSLAYGTLLGAIRHNGFIPWDDDIDIMVDRENYQKILSLPENGLYINNKQYYLVKRLWINRIKNKTDSDLSDPTIDIFILDNCPDSYLLRKFKTITLKILQGMMHDECKLSNKSNIIYEICLFITFYMGKFFSYEKLFFIYDKVSQIGKNKKKKYTSIYNTSFREVSIIYTLDFSQDTIRHTFENIELDILKEYDMFLRNTYGNYMVLPKKEERIPMHI